MLNFTKKITAVLFFATSLLIQQQTNQMRDNNEALGWAKESINIFEVMLPHRGSSIDLLLSVYVY